MGLNIRTLAMRNLQPQKQLKVEEQKEVPVKEEAPKQNEN